MSHLKLQKLVYYCEAFHLAYFDRALLNEDFEAWVHGPVCRAIFDQLKDTSVLYADVCFENDYDPNELLEKELNSAQVELITEVLNELSTWTGIQLESSTHKELPWKEARKGYSPAEKCSNLISKELMNSYYKKELND